MRDAAKETAMNVYDGQPFPLGVTRQQERINFAVETETGSDCRLLLRRMGTQEILKIPMPVVAGTICAVAVDASDASTMEYRYETDGLNHEDPYRRERREPFFSRVLLPDFDWEGDRPLEIPDCDVVAYSLHIRGFTRHRLSGVKDKGTFQGLTEKIPYLQELGINQIQCMPVYSFDGQASYVNYWGYGSGSFFAPNMYYAGSDDATLELKRMIRTCHQAGIEVVLSMPFDAQTTWQQMLDCLRYYAMEYHTDGFLVNPYVTPVKMLKEDPILKRVKILYLKDDFQNTMRRFLRGDRDVAGAVMHHMKSGGADTDSYHHITTHTGFTLCDLVSYEEKHNEENGEYNQDGPTENYSWNCGAEGKTYKKSVLELRLWQMKNAFCLLLLSRGTPCLLAGDEFANSQNGNNNVYCQDNETGWLVWKRGKTQTDLTDFVEKLIRLRKDFPILAAPVKDQGADDGIPELSFHSKEAWQLPKNGDGSFGAYYHQSGTDGADLFVAYNMQHDICRLALPTLRKEKVWYRIMSTALPDSFYDGQRIEDKTIGIEGHTIEIFVGR